MIGDKDRIITNKQVRPSCRPSWVTWSSSSSPLSPSLLTRWGTRCGPSWVTWMRAGWRPGWAHSTLSTSYRHGEYFAENTYFLSIIVSLNCKIFNRESRTRAAEGSRMPGEASRQCRYTRPGHHFGIQLARSFFTLHATKFSFCLEYQEKSLIYISNAMYTLKKKWFVALLLGHCRQNWNFT